jgi:23S rRNA (cytosine1962-C5)-methyltransferase
MTPDISETVYAAYKKREAIMPLSAYRLFNSDCDGIRGVAIDIYNDYAAVSWYLESALSKRNEIIKTLAERIGAASVYELYRFKSPGAPQNYSYVCGRRAGEFFTVEEAGSRFLCSFSHGQNTGFFIDNRANREIILKKARGKSVLNLFSYTGVLSVTAARGGAREVTSVDIGAAYNKWASNNLELNGFEEFSKKVYKFDAYDYLNFSAKKGRRFDLIIIDPPPFAAKLDNKPFSAIKDYHKLIAAALKAAAPGSIIIALCNMAEYGRAEFANMIGDTLLNQWRGRYKISAGPEMPFDFKCPARNYKLDYLKNYYISLY